ncbi:hypothetical protein NL676_022138 [Syzygium grande]|nr:hypothetical protein NL676_022138 [Syzygium grande]
MDRALSSREVGESSRLSVERRAQERNLRKHGDLDLLEPPITPREMKSTNGLSSRRTSAAPVDLGTRAGVAVRRRQGGALGFWQPGGGWGRLHGSITPITIDRARPTGRNSTPSPRLGLSTCSRPGPSASAPQTPAVPTSAKKRNHNFMIDRGDVCFNKCPSLPRAANGKYGGRANEKRQFYSSSAPCRSAGSSSHCLVLATSSYSHTRSLPAFPNLRNRRARHRGPPAETSEAEKFSLHEARPPVSPG